MSYLSTQEILKRCFESNENKLRVSNNYHVQDYFNAIYDDSQDALRVNLEGVLKSGMAVETVSEMPEAIEENLGRTILYMGDESDFERKHFYSLVFDDTTDEYVWEVLFKRPENILKTGMAIEVFDEMLAATEENLGRTVLYIGVDGDFENGSIYSLKFENNEYFWDEILTKTDKALVHSDAITLPVREEGMVTTAIVQGEEQEIEYSDGEDVYFMIKLNGYLLHLENYIDGVLDRLFTKTYYDSESDVSYVYLSEEGYDTISNGAINENVLICYFLSSSDVVTTSAIYKPDDRLIEKIGDSIVIEPWEQIYWEIDGECTLSIGDDWNLDGIQTAIMVIKVGVDALLEVVGAEVKGELEEGRNNLCVVTNLKGEFYFRIEK